MNYCSTLAASLLIISFLTGCDFKKNSLVGKVQRSDCQQGLAMLYLPNNQIIAGDRMLFITDAELYSAGLNRNARAAILLNPGQKYVKEYIYVTGEVQKAEGVEYI